MLINEDLLLKYGAQYESFTPKENILKKGDVVRQYIQIKSGTVETNNYHEDGKEFTHNIHHEGQSIGESFLFSDNSYPMYAVVKTDCKILKLEKSKFLQLLAENPLVFDNVLKHLSDRLFYKYLMLFNNSSSDPVSKIKTLMNYYKKSSSVDKEFDYIIPLTRQQIANLTGLRVETVIRTVKKMEQLNMLKVSERKIYF